MSGRPKKPSRAKARNTNRSTKSKSAGAGRPAAARGGKPIDLYYWPTPNGWKITIMLEECALPYTLVPVDISKGEEFEPAFLTISPNNRMPAIVDHDGPGGRPISIFESGAILQYLGRKTGKFYPREERARVEVEQWLFWQMANLGPKAGEANHFRKYAPEQLPYAIDRFSNEVNRIYGVMDGRLADRAFIAGDYSIADIACIGWASRAERFGFDLTGFPNVRRWLEAVLARPAVRRGLSVKVEAAFHVDTNDPKCAPSCSGRERAELFRRFSPVSLRSVTNALSALSGNQLLLMMKPRRAGAGASTVTWRSV